MPIGSILGRAVRRSEDPRFLTGAAQYSEDVPADGALHAVFVRSFVAHARVEGIDTSQARVMAGVAGVFTAADLALPPLADEAVGVAFARPLLAEGTVRFVGEPVAVVLAESRGQAIDAAETVVAEYGPLPAVADATRALDAEAPLLFPDAGTNVAREAEFVSEDGGEEPLAGAEVVVRGRFVNQRVAPVPMEVNGALAIPDPDGGGLTMYVPSQAPFWVRDQVARTVGLDRDALRVIAPDVGGGFGAKGETYAEQIVTAALALRVGRPVRYVETRSENMLAMVHGRAQVQEVELGAKRDGTIVGLRARVVADMGAYPVGTFLPQLTRRMASGVYRIPRIAFYSQAVVTNTTPVGAYRGAGRPEAAAMVERAVDMLAVELGMDPAEIRRRNFIAADGPWPFITATGAAYDAGDYERGMDEALRLAGYESLRREQAERRARRDPLQLGIGLSCYVEITGWGSEFGSVEVHPDGRITVLTGLSPHGQGHETSLAQLVSGTLGVPFEVVTVVHSDTGLVPRGEGTSGSRSLQVGGSAVVRAGEQVVEKARRIAAHLLEAGLDDVVLHESEAGDGQARLGVAGAPDRSLSWAELAAAAADADRLPDGMEPGLVAESDFDTEGNSTFPFGTHVAVVEVDMDTGRARLIRHVAVDDCGRILNPLLVEGQVHGGVAQGAAQALYEEVLYDEDANPLTANLMAYEMPSAADLPDLESHHTETPTPVNPLGAKGIGEAGTVGSTPAVQNAVIDALAHLGVRHIDMPLTPERVWRAIRDAPK
jgi:aerobic carbon-monoxide dehydrogenase large subunit